MRPLRALLLAAVAAASAGPASADSSGGGGTGALPSVSLLEGWRQPDGSRVAAIEIALPPGSHTYWRIPGDAGFPPDFDWSGSGNLRSVRYEWPRPAIIDSYGLTSFGYEGALVLPVLLTPADASAPIDLALSLTFGVCDDVCMREERRVATRLLPDAEGAGRDRIEAALAARARGAEEAGVAGMTCTIAPAGDGYALTAAVTFDRAPTARQMAVIESTQPGLSIGDSESRTEGRTVIVNAPADGAMLDRSALRVTVLDDSRAVEIRGCRGSG